MYSMRGTTGQFSRVCRSKKKVQSIAEDDSAHFTGQVSVINQVTQGDFLIELKVDKTVVQFDLDICAGVAVVGDKCAKGKVLKKPDLALDDVGRKSPERPGVFYATLHAPNGKTCCEKIYVVKEKPKALFEKPAISALGLTEKGFRATPNP